MGLGSPINPWGCHLRLLYGVNRPQVWSCGHCGATSYNLQCWEVCLWGQQIPGCPWTRWVKVQLGELSSVINKCLSLLTHYCSSVSATHFNHHSFWSSQGSSGRCLGKLSLCDSALGSRGCPTTAPLSSISMNARVGGFFLKINHCLCQWIVANCLTGLQLFSEYCVFEIPNSLNNLK